MEGVAFMAVRHAVDAIGSNNPTIFSHKKLTMSDCDRGQSRYLIPDENVRRQLNEEDLEKFQTVLIQRLSTGVVLKGRDWKRVVAAGNLAPGDDVVLWGFRSLEDGKLRKVGSHDVHICLLPMPQICPHHCGRSCNYDLTTTVKLGLSPFFLNGDLAEKNINVSLGILNRLAPTTQCNEHCD